MTGIQELDNANRIGGTRHLSDKLQSRGRPQGILVAADGITGDPGVLVDRAADDPQPLIPGAVVMVAGSVLRMQGRRTLVA
jgi:hypothetical protein